MAQKQENWSYATSIDEILTTVKGIILFESIYCLDKAQIEANLYKFNTVESSPVQRNCQTRKKCESSTQSLYGPEFFLLK